MKLINYKYGYHFDCSIHGKIVMTPTELEQAKKYLFNPAVKYHDIYYTPMMKRILRDDLERKLPLLKKGYWINIRVWATEKIVKHFQLPRYKRGNYVIEVTT